MALFWRQDRAGPLRPLPRHPSAHWWYTLDDELRAAGEEGLNTRLLALDLEAPDAAAGLPPLLLTTDQGQALHKGLPLPDQEEEGPLDTLMARMRDGLRDRTLIAPVLPGAADCTLATGPGTGAAEVPLVPKDSTVIGVIDDGIAFAHPAFRMDVGQRSRFASLWQQDAQCLRAGSADVPFGHVFSRAEIEQRLQEAGYDEDRFYRNLPPIGKKGSGPFRYRRLHGTHVADLAAGAGRGDEMDAAPEKFPIVAVNLPTAMVSDTAATFMAGAMILGVHDIMRRTEAMMRAADAAFPLIINLSFGLGGVGKNGGHLVASALEQAMAYWHRRHKVPMRVVLPAGNTLQSRLAAHANIAPGRPHRAVLRVAPDNRGSTYMEIAVSQRGLKPDYSSLSVKVTPPTGAGVFAPAMPKAPIRMDTALQLVMTKDQSSATDKGFAQFGIYHGFQRDFSPVDGAVEGTGVEIVTVALPPNAAADTYRPLPPCGDWIVEIALAPGQTEARDIELRVLRNDVPRQINPLRQRSTLVDPAYRSFDDDGFPETELHTTGCSITRAGTLNALSGGAQLVTVGASFVRREQLGDYSSAGPGGPLAEGATVSLHACADDGPALRGRLGAGSRSGSRVRMSGTSVAAPLVTRRLAQELAKWHQSAKDDPAGFAPVQSFASRAPHHPAERSGVGGLPPDDASLDHSFN